MTLSIVIPTYTISKELEEMAEVCAASYKDHGVDEIIIVEDGGQYSEMLRKIADIYIYSKKNVGFTATVNRGWRFSTADYTAIGNSDTFLMKGNLRDLCIPNYVTSPVEISGATGYMAGCFFCVPKTLRDKYGMLNEEMKMYSSDSDYEFRMWKHLKKVFSVEILHKVSQTVTPAGKNTAKQHEIDSKIYYKLQQEGKAAKPIPNLSRDISFNPDGTPTGTGTR